jgi:hypothetical protein
MTRNRVSVFALIAVTVLVAIARGARRDATEEAAIRKLIMKSGQHVTFETGILRVWQKEGGQWKLAASFSRPLDD